MRRGKRLFIAGGICFFLGAVFRFVLIGYGTTALCFCGLGACLLFYGMMLRWGTRTAKTLCVAAAALLAAGIGCFLAAELPVLRDARSDADTHADYLIVMGAAVHGTEPSLSMAERTDAALRWLLENPEGKAVVSGGQGPGEDISEARAMSDYLTERGIDPGRVLMEPEATTSYENLLFSLRAIEADGGDPAGRVALCSSEYHLHRTRYIALRLGCDPVMVAARTGYVTLRMNYLVREAFAMWKCWVFGIE